MYLKDIKTKFKIDGKEGNRVGYWCPKCKRAFNIKHSDNYIKWEFGSTLAKGYHKKCRSPVESIWEK